jgi:hypothetical protein
MLIRFDIGGVVTDITTGLAISPITDGYLVRPLNSDGSIGPVVVSTPSALIAILEDF